MIGSGYVGEMIPCSSLLLLVTMSLLISVTLKSPHLGNSGQFAVGRSRPLPCPAFCAQCRDGCSTRSGAHHPMAQSSDADALACRFVLAPHLQSGDRIPRNGVLVAIACTRITRHCWTQLSELAHFRYHRMHKLYRSRADWEAEGKTWRLRERAGLVRAA